MTYEKILLLLRTYSLDANDIFEVNEIDKRLNKSFQEKKMSDKYKNKKIDKQSQRKLKLSFYLNSQINYFHKVLSVFPLDNYRLLVRFLSGTTKIYDVKPLFDWKDSFKRLTENRLFYDVYVDAGGCGIVWNDDVDLSSDELWENGEIIKTPFDGLLSLEDATFIWNISEQKLKDYILNGKLKNGIDVNKIGKQWVVSTESMINIFGQPKNI